MQMIRLVCGVTMLIAKTLRRGGQTEGDSPDWRVLDPIDERRPPAAAKDHGSSDAVLLLPLLLPRRKHLRAKGGVLRRRK